MSGNILVPANIIEVRKGDSFDIFVHLKKDCKSIDLTNAMIILKAYNKGDNRVVLEKTAIGVDVQDGRMCLEIYANDTALLDVGDYFCDIKVHLEDGRIHTFFPSDVNKKATFRVTPKQ